MASCFYVMCQIEEAWTQQFQRAFFMYCVTEFVLQEIKNVLSQ